MDIKLLVRDNTLSNIVERRWKLLVHVVWVRGHRYFLFILVGIDHFWFLLRRRSFIFRMFNRSYIELSIKLDGLHQFVIHMSIKARPPRGHSSVDFLLLLLCLNFFRLFLLSECSSLLFERYKPRAWHQPILVSYQTVWSVFNLNWFFCCLYSLASFVNTFLRLRPPLSLTLYNCWLSRTALFDDHDSWIDWLINL